MRLIVCIVHNEPPHGQNVLEENGVDAVEFERAGGTLRQAGGLTYLLVTWMKIYIYVD